MIGFRAHLITKSTIVCHCHALDEYCTIKLTSLPSLNQLFPLPLMDLNKRGLKGPREEEEEHQEQEQNTEEKGKGGGYSELQ